jgi:hypothetical protein
LKNAVFWDVPQGCSCKKRRFGELGTLAVTSNRRTLFLRSLRRLLVTAKVPSSAIILTLKMKALRSSETSVLKRATWRNIPEEDILHSYRRENLKYYVE